MLVSFYDKNLARQNIKGSYNQINERSDLKE
jgi:hypothetical protein